MLKQLRTSEGIVKHWEISPTGRFHCSLDNDYLVPRRLSGAKKVYWQVQIKVNGGYRWRYVHRLMAFSWLKSPKSNLLYIVDHKDGNSLNNRVDNLRWVTATANNLNRKCVGLHFKDGLYSPKIAGYIHTRYATSDKELAKELRSNLVESYIRYNTRYPENGNRFPHKWIHNY